MALVYLAYTPPQQGLMVLLIFACILITCFVV